MLELKLEELKQRNINPYQAVIMASKEAHNISSKVADGIIQLDGKDKATTVALQKLIDGRVILEEDSTEG